MVTYNEVSDVFGTCADYFIETPEQLVRFSLHECLEWPALNQVMQTVVIAQENI
jgi:hypothetical protein